jgi:hypothetical protein
MASAERRLPDYYHGKTGKADGSKEYIRRGLLLKSLLDNANQKTVFSRLKREDLQNYRPFILVIWEPGKTAASCRWGNSGDSAQIEKNTVFPLTSASFNTGQVIKERRKRFGNLSSDGQERDAQFL